MESSVTTETKKTFLQNDRALVCSMLVFYGTCILGLVGAAFWGVNRVRTGLAADATATSNAVIVQQTNATATASAYLTVQDQYEYIERFETDSHRWFTGKYDPSDYGDATITIQDGVYIWQIDDPKGYTQSTDFYRGSTLRDFDVYVDLKFVNGSASESTCSGLIFRKSSLGWEDGAYTFSVCSDSSYEIYFYKTGKWDLIASAYDDTIRLADWNRIAIESRKSHYTFRINSATVFEMTDDRRKSGSLGLYIDAKDGKASTLWFDNFGFQTR